ncbi:KH domain-containing, RNA-binding, signal transduction-associated protein 2-like [Saccostrea echinata]|uniref:KH domain-containing, RNA-binding, signal transduction-associated protein 2-like n=1 Tax=Saccostrea echinata TaxID=191078 RepID=UPI002A83A696|nr:KH domain-containing, RNA-binding, signal transduction-associated protein 2-like [Saccostrea echinata]
MAGVNSDYVNELKNELGRIEQFDVKLVQTARILTEEIKKAEGGSKKVIPTVEAHHNRPQGVAVKVKIPQNEYPKFNFVGKLLGPKGMSLKRLQEETGTKMSILGRGSMRDKAKEDELKKEGGKYAHLNEELHVLVEVYSEISDAYARLSHALSELTKFLSPEYNDEIHQQQMEEMMYLNGEKAAGAGSVPGVGGRGRGRGGPGAGGRGGLLTSPAGRGAPPPRGAPARGAPRGVPAPRGAPAGRGRPAPPPPPRTETYDDYSTQAYEDPYADPYARDPYAETSYAAGDTQYFDYGHGSSAQGYDDGYAKESGWSAGGSSFKAPPAPRGGRGRPHPYASARGGY